MFGQHKSTTCLEIFNENHFYASFLNKSLNCIVKTDRKFTYGYLKSTCRNQIGLRKIACN